MKLLALDTATSVSSVALWVDGEVLEHAEITPRAGERILCMIDWLLAQASMPLRALDAIAFGRGPGAFTGLRLAAAVTQGLAFAAELPVMPISDLRAIAQRALHLSQAAPWALVCHDARMGQVYWGRFERHGAMACAQSPEAVSAPESVAFALATEASGCGAGTGFEAYPTLGVRFGGLLSSIHPALLPHAREIAQLAAHDGLTAALPAELALPVYVRDQVAVPRQ
jgi:tRNA threonylcarbamoyladenosine biosynthesis protein TsaB